MGFVLSLFCANHYKLTKHAPSLCAPILACQLAFLSVISSLRTSCGFVCHLYFCQICLRTKMNHVATTRKVSMNLQQMRLSEASLGKLSQLAMAVELHEQKRFSLRKDIDHVIGLLKVASNSANAIIQTKLEDLSDSLSDDSHGFFRTLGVELKTKIDTPTAVKSKKTYRGQVVVSDAPSTANQAEPPASEAPKKKIIYRGKVMYR